MRSELSSAILTLRAAAVAFISVEPSAVACASLRRQSVHSGERRAGKIATDFSLFHFSLVPRNFDDGAWVI
jgi:hypothetical protein